jgi:hypothetical protein
MKGRSPENFLWCVYGGVLGLICLAGALMSGKSSRFVKKVVPRWEESSLVISPAGIALIQGDLRGEMRWDELRDVRLGGGKSNFGLGDANQTAWLPSIQLVVAGAVVRIFDVYDRPLVTIAKIVRTLWGQPARP